jgi:hypothetical protein
VACFNIVSTYGVLPHFDSVMRSETSFGVQVRLAAPPNSVRKGWDVCQNKERDSDSAHTKVDINFLFFISDAYIPKSSAILSNAFR